MGAEVTILNQFNQVLYDRKFKQAGSIISVPYPVDEGVVIPVPSSEATWTYNYHPIWKEIGWNPWRWFDEMGDEIIINKSVVELLNTQQALIGKLHDQNRSRNQYNDGYWAATPANAVNMMAWFIRWSNYPGAFKIVRGSH